MGGGLFVAVNSLAEGCVVADCSSWSYGIGLCGGSVKAVGSLEEIWVVDCLQQPTCRQRVVWQLISAVNPTAEDHVAAGLGVVYSLEESQTAAPLNKSDGSVCRYLGNLPSMLSEFTSVFLDKL